MDSRLVIYIDTREQTPLDFSYFPNIIVNQNTHNVGDYSCVMFNNGLHSAPTTSRTIFERKSKADLWGTLGGDHSRFKREMERAKNIGINLVLIIECPLTSINNGYKYRKGGKSIASKFSGPAMVKKLGTLRERYGLEIVYCKNKKDMELCIYQRWFAECRELEIK